MSESGGPSTVRIAIVDDHPIFRDGLKKLLESEPGFVVVGEASDGMDAAALVQRVNPDVLLLDVAMPRLGGLETLAAIQGRSTRVLLLTAAISDARIVRALELGARGVVLKETATEYLLASIRLVFDGDYVVRGGAVKTLAEALQLLGGQREPRYSLTPRELEIISAIVAGASNRDIAALHSISIQTVKHHLTSIFAKTGVSSRLELAHLAVTASIIGDE